MGKYNCLLIMMDQLRFDCLGYSSRGLVETPNIDWLASLGTVFTNAYTPSPSCIPARASLMTGQKPWTTGVLFTGNSAGPHKKGGVMGCNFKHTLAGELVKNGYHAEGIGKMHFFPQRSLMGFSHTLIDESGREEDKNFMSDYKTWFLQNNPQMYDITDHGVHWNSWMARPFHASEEYHPSNWTVSESLKYLKNRDPSMPFFLNMSFSRPHSPYDASQYFFDKYRGREKPENAHGEWSEKYKPFDGSVLAWHGDIGQARRDEAWCGYLGSITQTDYQIGRMLTTLNKQKLLDEMLIVFLSDHGDMMGDHYLMRKTYAYEGSAHIPFIVKLPKSLQKEGGQVRTCNDPVSIYDVMPTVLDICGSEIPDECEGLSLKGSCNGDKLDRRFVEGEHIECYSPEEDNFFVIDGKYKYIYFLRTGAEMFFDLEKDPKETANLVNEQEYEEKVKEFRQQAIAELSSWNTDDCIFAQNGKLSPIKYDKQIISPNYEKRLAESVFKWM